MRTKREIVMALGKIIMGPDISKKDKEVIFDAYKLLSDYIDSESANKKPEESGFVKFAKVMSEREDEKKYLKWRDEYIEQLTWFYKYLGFPNAHAIDDILYIGSNNVMGYNLRLLYKELEKEDEL